MTLLDEMHERIAERMVTITGHLVERPIFGDLIWSRTPSLDLLMPEPAVVIETDARVIAMHRLGQEIRYYAGPNARRDAADRGPAELGIVPGVDEAIDLASAFLGGEALARILVAREVKSTWAARRQPAGA